jgi:GxxExxY protein
MPYAFNQQVCLDARQVRIFLLYFSDSIFLTKYMPITTGISLNPIKQEDFAKLDYQVMRHAFECQNELGRLCDEVIYQNDLAARLETAGLPTLKEVPVTVAHRDFTKIYWLDLVVAQAGIYELKTVTALVGAHEAQLLNYLFLCGSNHGKLINFRPVIVESRFLNTTLSQAERRQFSVEAEDWQEPNRTDVDFREGLVGLLQDWGGWLDLDLYTEALVHFAGGADRVAQMLPLTKGQSGLGKQRFHLLNPETAFRVTAMTDGAADYEHHLRSLLRISPLRAIQWVNLARNRIQLVSLVK